MEIIPIYLEFSHGAYMDNFTVKLSSRNKTDVVIRKLVHNNNNLLIIKFPSFFDYNLTIFNVYFHISKLGYPARFAPQGKFV